LSDSRLQKLEAMLSEAPDDQLLRYMLAMELEKTGDHDRSLSLLGDLMNSTPPYVPAFLMAGQQYVAIGQPDEARSVWKTGITAAQAANDDHAAGEMTQFLNDLA